MLLRTLLLFALTAAICAGPQAALAQISLKTGDTDYSALRVKALNANVHISGQVAVTRLDITFENESEENTEADFQYALPDGAVVTRFAYYFGSELVEARIVEKERASRIFTRLTQTMMDPALVEKVAGNRFHARISPVAGNSDLRVLMTLVQVLPSQGDDVIYDFPLRESLMDDQLDSLRIDIRSDRRADIARVRNSLGLPVLQHAQSSEILMQARDQCLPQALSVRLARRHSPLHAELTSARSGGANGFFALALTPAHTLAAPHVSIDGVSVYDVIGPGANVVGAGQSIMVFGRYRGSGAARVTITGRMGGRRAVYTQTVAFSDASELNNAATKLWASRLIDQLTGSHAGRAAVTAVSLRYCLPSDFTSWLAMPDSVRLQLAQEVATPELNSLEERLAAEMLAGRGNSQRALRLRTQGETLAKSVRLEFSIDSNLHQTLDPIAEQVDYEIVAGRPDSQAARSARASLETLTARAGMSVDYMLEYMLQNAKDAYADDRAKSLANNIALTGEPQANDLAAVLAAQDLEGQFSRELTDVVYSTRQSYMDLISDGLEDSSQAKEKSLEIARLQSAWTVLNPNEPFWSSRSDDIGQAECRGYGVKLAQEITAGRGDGERADELRTSLAKLRSKYFWIGPVAQALRPALSQLGQIVAEQALAGTPNSSTAKAARAKYRLYAGQAGERVDSLENLTGQYLDGAMTSATEALAGEIKAGRAYSPAASRARRRLRYLEGVGSLDVETAMERQLEGQQTAAADRYAGAVLAGATKSAHGRALAERLRELTDPTDYTFREAMTDALQDSMDRTVWSISDAIEVGDQGKADRLTRALEYLTSFTNQDAGHLVRQDCSDRMNVLAAQLSRQIRGGYADAVHGLYDVQFIPTGPGDPAREEFLRRRLAALAPYGGDVNAHLYNVELAWHAYDDQFAIKDLWAESGKASPNQNEMARLTKRLLDDENAFKPTGYAKAHAEIFRLMSERTANGRAPAVDDQINELHVRMGDPLIIFNAPSDFREVIAVLPSGQIVRLVYIVERARWEGRFDVPDYAQSGEYDIRIIAVSANGTRTVSHLVYRVCLTPPSANAQARIVSSAGGPALRLTAQGSGGMLARVVAYTPVGVVVLAPSVTRPDRFFAVAPIRPGSLAPGAAVRFEVVDKAHNRAAFSAKVEGPGQ